MTALHVEYAQRYGPYPGQGGWQMGPCLGLPVGVHNWTPVTTHDLQSAIAIVLVWT